MPLDEGEWGFLQCAYAVWTNPEGLNTVTVLNVHLPHVNGNTFLAKFSGGYCFL